MKDTLVNEVEEHRKSDYEINPLILQRYSPRAMSGECVTDDELFPLFEAARWAPSSYNHQPWRILYAKRDTAYWSRLFDLLVEFNQQSCKNAAALGLFFSRTTFEINNKPSRTHAFDTGAAWENLCLEGTARGLVVHGMEGFDYTKARLLIPNDYEVHVMFAIGKIDHKSILCRDLESEETPFSRKKIREFVFEGKIS